MAESQSFVQHHVPAPAYEVDRLINAIDEPALRMYAKDGVRQLRMKLGRGKSWESMAARHRLRRLAARTLDELTELLRESRQQETVSDPLN